MKRHLWLLASLSALLVAACGSNPSQPEVHNPKLPQGSTIAVVDFRDCTIADQDDCKGSGAKVTSIFMTQFGTAHVFHADRLSRPMDAAAELSDAAAAAYAKSKGYAYVMNGDVTDYFQATAFTGWWRKERAAVTVRLLDTATGKILYVHTDSDTANNGHGSPDGMFQSMASNVQDDIEDN
jgi:curli biogenesis system outer membrane secretion channel CsgG